MFRKAWKAIVFTIQLFGHLLKAIASSADRAETATCRMAMDTTLHVMKVKGIGHRKEDIEKWNIVISHARRLLEKEPDDPTELHGIIANAQQKLELIKSLD